jgi:thymidine phosphorylase
VSATVPSIPLIASSVMSKKLAAGAGAVVLDVKFGRGAFMPDAGAAVELARSMVTIGEGAGMRTVAVVTAMDHPLGRSVGNALEVLEALDVLAGRGSPELTQVCVAVAREMCHLAGVRDDPAEAIRGGRGERKLWEMLEAQGGRRDSLPVAYPVTFTVRAAREGWVKSIAALACGLAVIDLGGGRRRKEDSIDHAAGLTIEAEVGRRVARGAPLVGIHAASEEIGRRALSRLEGAWEIADEEVERLPYVRYRVDRDGATPGASMPASASAGSRVGLK